jgi:pyruvate carboxylase subunit B
MVAALKDTPYDTGLDLELLYEIGEYFAALCAKYRVLFTAEVTRPSVNVLLHQIPGGMLSNLVSQLREQNALNKLSEVLEEVPQTRADLGYPPLVTPTSQIVGIQAVLNVLSGERYKKVTKEVKDYLLGYYGRPPGDISEEVRRVVVNNERPIDVRPAELIEPELEKMRADGHKLGIIHQEEDVVTYALYPQVAVKFLRGELKEEIIPTAVEASATGSPSLELPMEFSVDVDGEVFNVKIASVLGKTIEVQKPKKPPKELPPGAIASPMQGMIIAIKVKVGEKVKKDDVVATIEVMKMVNEVHSPHSGVVKEILAYEGEIVNAGDILMIVETNDK